MNRFDEMNEHQDFVEWKQGHPEGFVINWKSQTKPMLHMADCRHMVFEPDDDVSLTRRPKNCLRDRGGFDEWAVTHHVEGLVFCKTCSSRT